MLDIDTLRKFKTLRQKKTDLKEELRLLEEEIGMIEGQILESFADLGIGSIEIDGKKIVTTSQIWAKVQPGMKKRAQEILEKRGLDSLVSFNYQSLSAHVREIVKSGENLPPEYEGVIGFYDKMGLRLSS